MFYKSPSGPRISVLVSTNSQSSAISLKVVFQLKFSWRFLNTFSKKKLVSANIFTVNVFNRSHFDSSAGLRVGVYRFTPRPE